MKITYKGPRAFDLPVVVEITATGPESWNSCPLVCHYCLRKIINGEAINE